MASVLIAEDSSEARYLLAAELRIAGYQVREAKDGKEALDLYLASTPDAIITDIQMPFLDGIGLVTAVRHVDKQTPIIVVSAGGKLLLQHACAAGANLCVEKPFDCAELVASIESLLIGRIQ